MIVHLKSVNKFIVCMAFIKIYSYSLFEKWLQARKVRARIGYVGFLIGNMQ